MYFCHFVRIYYDSVSFTPDDVSHTEQGAAHSFVPSAPAPALVVPPTEAKKTPTVDIVVKGLPGAGPRLAGAKTTFSPPLYNHLPYDHFHKWSPQKPICDDKVNLR